MVTYPSDWKVSTLGNIGTFTKGAPLSKADISETGTPFVLYGELYTTYNEVTYKIYRHTKRSVDSLYYSNIGDVIIPTSGETAEEIATACCIMVPGAILAGDLNIYRADGFDGRYVSYVINHVVNRQIADVAQGISIIHVNAKQLKKIEIHYPELPEQKAIADTLDTFDTHIANLAELIEKKKAIRDGALEDLVSGGTRLAGFSGKWEKMPLGQFTEINPRTIIPDTFMYVDLESVKGITLLIPRRENIRSAPSRAQRYARKGDVFYQTVRPYQKNNFLFNLDGDYVFSTGYAQLRTTNDPNYLFLLIRMDSFVNKVLERCTGTSYPAINPRHLAEIPVFVPADIDEQKAIADVLMAMDDEIKALEDERDKMIQIREGAMDDLLTGRVRLEA